MNLMSPNPQPARVTSQQGMKMDASLPPKKIVIFYSSIGYGHISAAQAIRAEIHRQSRNTEVVLQDIRAFMHPLWRRVDERLYWFVASNLPECFESLFDAMQTRGNRIPSLSMLPTDYPEGKVHAYLTQQAPDVILSTHYGAAQVLGTLREKGFLANRRIGWLHTDFFEGYFPRISKLIDRTFLAHPELESRWLAAGVPPDKVITSGMPVQVEAVSAVARQDIRACIGLSPDIPTLTLAGGKEGRGDYVDFIYSVMRHVPCSLQIIAACGANASLRARLEELRGSLPSRLTLKVVGLVPRSDMTAYIGAADVLITKAGGLTLAEAFTIGVPTILLDVISGHERENAALFVRQGLASFAGNAEDAGRLVEEILSDPVRREEILTAQRQYRERTNIVSIARFALDDAEDPVYPLRTYGVEDGAPVLGIDAALARLDAESPAEVELLLSYATSQTPERIVRENPFGHLAIRIEGVVYSANYIADPSVDPNFLQHVSLADYLYGVTRPSPSQVHTNTYGMAYGRETLGLRVRGVPPESRAAMVAEARRQEGAFRDGSLQWHRSDFNCADVVAQMLAAGGYGRRSLGNRIGLPSMPLDVFEGIRARFEEDPSLQEELIAYRLLPGTQAPYRFSRFPLSMWQPLRSMARVLSDASRDELEQATTRQVTGYFSDSRLYVEDLRACRSASGTEDIPLVERPPLALEEAILADLRRVLAVYLELPFQRIGRLEGHPAIKGFDALVNRGLELARLATEHAEDGLLRLRADRLRALFNRLVEDYGQIDPQRFELRHVQVYLAQLRAFESVLGRELLPPGASWTDRVRISLHVWWRQKVVFARRVAQVYFRKREK